MKNKLIVNYERKSDNDEMIFPFDHEPSLPEIVKKMKDIEKSCGTMPYFFALVEEDQSIFESFDDIVIYYINATIVDKALLQDQGLIDLAQKNNCSKVALLQRDGEIKLVYAYKGIDKTINIA